MIGDLKNLPFQQFVPANVRAHPLNPSFVNWKIVVSTRRRIVTRTYPDFDGAQAASKFLLTYVLNYDIRWVIGLAFRAVTLIGLHEVLTGSIKFAAPRRDHAATTGASSLASCIVPALVRRSTPMHYN